MNRRKALLGTALISGIVYSGYKLFDFFTPHNIEKLDLNKALIDELAEIIIPRTETPGAKDVLAGELIIKLLKDCTTTNTQNNFIAGLMQLKSAAISEYGKEFLNCSLPQQITLLNIIEQDEKPFNGIVWKIQKKLLGKSFIYTLKEYTTKAYCTSMLGATQGLKYVLIPGRRLACTDAEPNQKSWATQ